MSHARLSPSAAHRWMACAGSAVLEAGIPRGSSAHAAEGTAAHAAAAAIIEGRSPSEFIGPSVVDGHTIVLTTEHIAHVMRYVDALRERVTEDDVLEVEQKLDLSDAAGEPCFGTADAVVLRPGKSTIEVHDLKFGMGVPVSAENNEQMLCYAVGAIDKFGIVSDFDNVVLHIHQPRIDNTNEWATTIAEVRKFASRLSYSSKATRNAADVARVQGIESREFRAFLRPGEKQCRWCAAKAACPAIERQMTELFASADAPAGMTVVDAVALAPQPQALPDAKLALIVEHSGMIEDWIKAVRAEAQGRLMSGRPVGGLKLVEGRRGTRTLKDAAAAEAILADVPDAWEPRALKSVAQLEKSKLPADKWEAVKPLIVQPAGKPHVALESDKRPAYTPALDSDFSDFSDG